jgi:opacity protein-like surface antigen
MKKIVISFITFLTVFSSSAFAKTEGLQLGINFVYSMVSHNYTTDTGYVSRPKFENSSTGFGGNIQYAFNIDKILMAEPLVPVFISPEIFMEKIGTTAKDYNEEDINIDSRYGFKLNFGIDFTENFFVYATGGVGAVNYDIDWQRTYNSKKSGTAVGFLYGGGLGYHIGDFIVSLEYNKQNVDLKTNPLFTGSTEVGTIQFVETGLNVAKVGISYQF